MQTWEDLKRSEAALLKREAELQLECVRCLKCDSTWFEEVDCYQFKADHHLILGQNVPTRRTGMIPYKMLRCLQCQNLLEPRIISNTRDIAGNDYDHLLDTLEGKLDKRTKRDLQVEVTALQAKVQELEKALAVKKSKKEKDEVPG